MQVQQARHGHRRADWMAALTLALLLFVRHDERAHWSASWTANEQPQEQRQPFVLLASGAYLDSVGQFSNVLNEFVNSLLEKVSFLAEIIIESSLNEECTWPTTTTTSEASLEVSCRDYARRHNLSAAGKPLERLQLARNQFDEREFKNVDVFLESYAQLDVGGGGGGGGSAGGSQQTGCKIFSLDLSQRDLPVDQMGQCCNQFGACYSQCQRTKLACDLQFRDCLTRSCKTNFDYRNATLVQLQREHLTKRHLDDEDGPLEPLAEADEEQETLVPQSETERRTTDGTQTGSSQHENTKSIIKRLRDKYKACKLASKLLIIGNLAFGCQNYKQSQWHACCTSNQQQQ